MGESVWAWSKTAASNSTADSSINWAEGQSPGSVNNSARSMMAAIAKLRDDQGGALTLAGGTTAYTATTNQGLGSLADGARIHVVVNAANTGAVTLNVDALGAKSLRKNVAGRATDIIAGEMQIDMHLVLEYDASVNGATGAWIWLNAPTLPTPGAINGLILSNSAVDATNDIVIAAGTATDSTGLVTMRLASALTKALDATWVVGTGAGGMASGTTKTAATWYYAYLIMRSDTGVVDVVFDDNRTTPSQPTNYTHFRYIGAVYNNVSDVLAQFVQSTADPDEFIWEDPTNDVQVANLGTTSASYTATAPPATHAHLSGYYADATVAQILYVRATGQTNAAAAIPYYTASNPVAAQSVPWFKTILIDASSQFAARSSSADSTFGAICHGWKDTRGRV